MTVISTLLETHIEALLFYVAEPIAVGELARLLDRPTTDVETALTALDARLADRGIRLMRFGENVELRTAGESAPFIEKLREDELSRELSRASLETLAVVLYEGPVTRSEIDHTRGVQSQSSIRALSSRGLIEKITEHNGKRGSFYRATTETLGHLGIRDIKELPAYADTLSQLKQHTRATEPLARAS